MVNRSFLAILVVTILVAAAAGAVSYSFTSTIVKPHQPAKVTLVDSSLKVQDVAVNFTENSVTVKIFNSGSAAESSTVYVAVNSITAALYSSPGTSYSVQGNSVTSTKIMIPLDLTTAYTIIVTW